ncbi:uncharacterized protein [Temnothorax nylanderi]|uniref:uncharacterized protein isoform X2 n=1 Tax=Temnothorax nylanderi TaxID=102681 RepID=UPI003A89601A
MPHHAPNHSNALQKLICFNRHLLSVIQVLVVFIGMSVVSSRVSSIKQPGKVYFKLSKDVKNILCNSASSDGIKEYEKLIHSLKEGAIKDSDLTEFLTEARQCISLLDIRHESFVQALLQIEWTNRSPEVISTYKFFLQDLVRMQTVHIKIVINRLIELYKPEDNAEHEIGQFKSEDMERLNHIHDIMYKILKVLPMPDITRFIEMEIDTPECVEEKEQTQQSSSPRLEPENSSSESFAYLQKTINDPTNAIVQHQIQGNTAKMLVMLTTGEQRLITFDIPNEDCTVHDLLDQARAVLSQVNISFPGETQVSLVDDPALGINYIVEGGVMHTSSLDGSDGDCNSTQEIVSTIANAEKLPQNVNTSDENSNTSSQTSEEPILVKEMLALCPHCGYSSLHFNRCERCNTKLKIEKVKSVPIAERKETGMSVDMFYKKNNSERNVVKLEKIERDGPICKRPRREGKSAASKPKPIHKELECLTISSDEEEESKTKKTEVTDREVSISQQLHKQLLHESKLIRELKLRVINDLKLIYDL